MRQEEEKRDRINHGLGSSGASSREICLPTRKVPRSIFASRFRGSELFWRRFVFRKLDASAYRDIIAVIWFFAAAHIFDRQAVFFSDLRQRACRDKAGRFVVQIEGCPGELYSLSLSLQFHF